MSFFVLTYDRTQQKLLELREFAETERAEADAHRLLRQREALQGAFDQDVVLFQAASREALERTHGSYFLSGQELLERTQRAFEAS